MIKTPDNIVTVDGNLVGGLYVVVKSGNVEWNVAGGWPLRLYIIFE